MWKPETRIQMFILNFRRVVIASIIIRVADIEFSEAAQFNPYSRKKRPENSPKQEKFDVSSTGIPHGGVHRCNPKWK